jgi:hypothetical protein
LIWIGSDQLKTFGPTISSLIYNNIPPERMCLWDSKERGGRPDILHLVAAVYREWDAEVVLITSNWDGNKELMEGCKRLRIPAFVSLSRSCSGVYAELTFSSSGGHALGFLTSFPFFISLQSSYLLAPLASRSLPLKLLLLRDSRISPLVVTPIVLIPTADDTSTPS